jgi:hypothetical protein
MRRNSLLLFFIVITFLSAYSHAQAWSGVLSPSRAVDWSNAGAVIDPTGPRAQCGSTIAAGASVATINSAIAACAANHYVLLGAGTFNLSGQILFNNKSNVTLRGAGPDQTFVVFSNSGSYGCTGLGGDVCILNGNDNSYGDNSSAWTAGYSVGTTSITLTTTTNLQVGSMLVLDQLDDASLPAADMYVCAQTGTCATEGAVSGRSGRGQHQAVKVTSISGSTVGITPALYLPNWRSNRTPQAWWSAALPVSGVGIEDITLDHRNSTTGGNNGGGIFFSNAYGCWVKNVRSLNNGLHKHVWAYQTAHITVRDSYFMGSQGANESYGVDCSYSSSDILVENNIFQHIASAFDGEGCTGSVGAYNFNLDDSYTTDSGWQQAGQYHHSVGDAFMLWEGNYGIGMTNDAVHGTSNFFTAFRNYWTGRDPNGGSSGGKTEQTSSVLLYMYSRFTNLIGNVLGTSGYHTAYQCAAATTSDSCSAGDPNRAIYGLGYSGHYSNQSGINNDPFTVTSLMRWGNYDVVSGAPRFVASEVPSGLSLYANPVPASQTLPASFYLNGKPSWWGSAIPWPPIGPDVTGGNVANVGGHANRIPAANCYLNVMGGSTAGGTTAYTFNANNCYSASSVPAPPTNLNVVVQ